jgi:hypothetical protein
MSHTFVFRPFSVFFIVFLAVSEPLAADPPDGKARGQKPHEPSVYLAARGEAQFAVGASGSVTLSAGISFGEARELAVEHGMTGTKPLPPGIRKNLARGKPMPPGIAKTRMPGPFESHLPHHDGYEWRQAGTDLLLVAVGTLIIADILEHVFD